MGTPSHYRASTTAVDADQPSTGDANEQSRAGDSRRPEDQKVNIQIGTGGGTYVDGNLNIQGGDFVGGDKHIYHTVATQPIALPPQPPAPPQLFIGRQAELGQLQGWLTEVTPDFLRNSAQPEGKLALIYGPPAAGKSTLIRHWLAELRTGEQPPIIAHLSFARALLADTTQSIQSLSQTRYALAWAEPADQLLTYFPTTFPLDCYFWVTLAVQLAHQSPHLRQALERDEEWTRELRYNTPQPPTEALTTLLALAAEERRPIIIACEGLQHCTDPWFDLFKAWAKAIRSQPWPVLLLLEYDYPQPFATSTDEAAGDERLTWLRQRCGAPYFLAEACYLASLNRHEIEAILLPGSQQYAHDLFLMSEGLLQRLHDLLYAWRKQGAAHEKLPGYWQIDWVPTNLGPFLTDEPLLNIVKRSLAHSAELAADLGYEEVNAATLQAWLNYAVWEGDAFHDQALALAVGWQDDALNDFLTIIDKALCQSEQHPQGLLAEIEESIALPDGDNQTRYLTRYRFVEPLVAVLLRQRQSPSERLRYGQAYAEALETVYAPHHERILETLATIYQSLGLTDLAADYRQRWHTLLYLAQEEAALTAGLPLAKSEGEQWSLLSRILRFYSDAYRRRPPGQLLPWLHTALSFSQRLRDQWREATTLHNIGLVYAALGEQQKALRYYNLALPLRQHVGDKGGEAQTLSNIGLVHFLLREQQEALCYFNLALPLRRQVGNKGGEAQTLNNIGLVYADLGEKQEALRYYNLALPLLRQVGNKGGEAATFNNIGLVYAALGEQQEALRYYNLALPLCRQVDDKGGEATTLSNIGSVYSALGEKQEALCYFSLALPLLRRVNDHWNEPITLEWIAHTYEALNDLTRAEEFFAAAVEAAAAVKHPDLPKIQNDLARIRNKLTGAG